MLKQEGEREILEEHCGAGVEGLNGGEEKVIGGGDGGAIGAERGGSGGREGETEGEKKEEDGEEEWGGEGREDGMEEGERGGGKIELLEVEEDLERRTEEAGWK